ncbi:DeoR family transcriptional regulator [Saccharopolyspora sp. NPDC000995]
MAEDDGVRVNQHDRREQIRQEVLASGFVRIEGLAAKHGVSGMTIHRDLDVLEQQGWLRKVRGGATSTPTALLETSVRARIADAADEKARIAKHAVRLVSPGQVVALDDPGPTPPTTSVRSPRSTCPGDGQIDVPDPHGQQRSGHAR